MAAKVTRGGLGKAFRNVAIAVGIIYFAWDIIEHKVELARDLNKLGAEVDGEVHKVFPAHPVFDLHLGEDEVLNIKVKNREMVGKSRNVRDHILNVGDCVIKTEKSSRGEEVIGWEMSGQCRK